MAKKIKIKEETCIGCGACQALCPDVFELDGKNGKAKIKKGADIEKNQSCVVDAIASCPVSAVEED